MLIYICVYFANLAKNSRSVYPTAELSSPGGSGAASQPFAIGPSSKLQFPEAMFNQFYQEVTSFLSRY